MALQRFFLIVASVLLILALPEMAWAQTSSPSFPPAAFQRSMVFVDGTNLFYRFEEMKLSVSSFYEMFRQLLAARYKPSLMRIYWYTIKEKHDRLLKIHGENCLDKIRVIFGTGVPTSGEPKEKGVDALLVADLIYHAASKNIEHAHIVTIDLDFYYAIRRVEDFGCRTAVVAFGHNAPLGLQRECDEYLFVPRDNLVKLTHVSERKPK